MMKPLSLDQLLEHDQIASTQVAIVATLTRLFPGVRVVLHPGRVDISELIGKTVASAPGIGLGWSRVRRASLLDGSYSALVEWTAYIVAEAKVVGARRVEKEAVGLAIGSRLLAILSDQTECFWGLEGIYPPSHNPPAEFKPLFTVRDAAEGTVYYTVTWTQQIADLGHTHFPTATGSIDMETGTIAYEDPEALEALSHFLAMEQGVPDA